MTLSAIKAFLKERDIFALFRLIPMAVSVLRPCNLSQMPDAFLTRLPAADDVARAKFRMLGRRHMSHRRTAGDYISSIEHLIQRIARCAQR